MNSNQSAAQVTTTVEKLYAASVAARKEWVATFDAATVARDAYRAARVELDITDGMASDITERCIAVDTYYAADAAQHTTDAASAAAFDRMEAAEGAYRDARDARRARQAAQRARLTRTVGDVKLDVCQTRVNAEWDRETGAVFIGDYRVSDGEAATFAAWPTVQLAKRTDNPLFAS